LPNGSMLTIKSLILNAINPLYLDGIPPAGGQSETLGAKI